MQTVSIVLHFSRVTRPEVTGTAHHSKILAALAEDLGWVPITHMVVYNHLKLQFQLSDTLFWPS